MSSERPNVVIMITDDLAWGDLKFYGNPYTETPHIDELAKASVRFGRHCSGPVCSPARASLMTGRYHYRTKVVDTFMGRSMMESSETTMAELFRDHGYCTGIFGKWHLGDCYPMRAMDMGFEESLVHNGGGIGQPGDFEGNSYFNPVLYRNGFPQKCAGYCADIFTDAAIDFIQEHKHKPFFVYLATNTPHTPLQIEESKWRRFLDLGVNERHAKIYGMVENIDENFGRLKAALDQACVTQNTIIIFTSDHGPDRMAQNNEVIRFNAGLRGSKGQLYEGGIRVPFFWKWDRLDVKTNEVSVPTHPIDVMPTLLDAAEISMPGDVSIDGVSLMPLFLNRSTQGDDFHRNIFMQWHRGDVPIRYRNYAVIDSRYKLYGRVDGVAEELYDLCEDPYEQTDLSQRMPDRVMHMRRCYDHWFDDVSNTRNNNYAPPPIIIGETDITILTRQDWRIHGEDGWGDSHYGHWEVEVSRADKYDVRFSFTQIPTEGELVFRYQNVNYSVPVSSCSQSAVIENIAMECSRGDIEAWIEMQGVSCSVEYIYIGKSSSL